MRGWLTYRIHGQNLIFTAEGDYASREIEAVLTAALDDPDVPNPTRLVVDLRKSSSRPGGDKVAEGVLALEHILPRVQACAFVVSEPADFARVRTYRVRTDRGLGPLIQPSWDLPGAEAWLRLRDTPPTAAGSLQDKGSPKPATRSSSGAT